MSIPVIPIGKYEIPPIYTPLFYDDTFIKLLYGGRSSGKTDIAVMLMLNDCLSLDYFKCLLVRRVKTAVKQSLYSKVKSVCERKNIAHLFDFKDHTGVITCLKNGNMFIPMGTYETLGNTGTSKGVDDPTHAIVDEMDELTEDEWKKLIKSIRGPVGSPLSVIGIFNTHIVNEDHWIYKRFFPAEGVESFERKDGKFHYIPSRRSNVTILHTTYLDNHYTSDQQIQEYEEDKLNDIEEYEISGLGLLKAKKHENLALKYFKRSTHVNENAKFDPSVMVWLGWDFNNLPHNTIGVWQYGGFDEHDKVYKMNLVKEFCIPNNTITEDQTHICKWLKENKYQHQKLAIVCDASGKRKDDERRTQINKVTTAIKREGFIPVNNTLKGNPSVIASLDFLNDIFGCNVKTEAVRRHANATIMIQVNPACKFHIADFEKTKTGTDGRLLKVKATDQIIEDGIKVRRTYEKRGHGVDEARYIFTAIFAKEYKKHKSKKI